MTTKTAVVTEKSARTLLERLPSVRGDLRPFVSLAQGSWLGVGGPAEVFFKPQDENDLGEFLAKCPTDMPVTMIGATSNLLVRDGGVPGVVIHFGPMFARIATKDGQVLAGAGAHASLVARRAMEVGLAGLEFMADIPGTMGGALRMNAGAHGRAIEDVLVETKVMNRLGHTDILPPESLKFGYRTSGLPDDVIFLGAVLTGQPDDPAEIEKRMAANKNHRIAFQPQRVRTAGSTFANPENGPRAWELIEKAGCRGLTLRGAKMDEKHCNFMVNTGNATAADLETLGEQVRQKVLETSGIDLRWEVRRIGVPLTDTGGKA